MEGQKRQYGLFTAITMIVGVCIGSGIFYKCDNILEATGGSVVKGVIMFVLGAVAIVFGGLSIAYLAARTEKPGGVITYMEEFIGRPAGCAMGWFQVFVYYPALTIVVSWVVGIYTCVLFNLPMTLELQLLIGGGFCLLCFLYNVLSPRFGGWFQNGSTIIKLIPLVLLSVAGLLFGDVGAGLRAAPIRQVAGAAWISAIGPIAYSFDGWIISTSISHEIKNSKRNLPLALILAPLIVLVVYLAYFLGMSSYLGAESILTLGDSYVAVAAEGIFGSWFAKLITVFVIISVMGTVNGIVLGYIRLPYAMALRGDTMPLSGLLKKESKKLHMPLASAVFALILSALWGAAHYLTQHFNLLPNSDVSEIAIAVSYLMYVLLYVKLITLFAKHEAGVFRGLVCPVMGILGALIILWGGLQNPLFIYYVLINVAVIALSLVYYGMRHRKTAKAGK